MNAPAAGVPGHRAVLGGRDDSRDASDDPVARAWEALRCVYDPELCLDVVSLGLVYNIRREAAGLTVEMTLTTIGCPVSESLPEIARATVADALGPGVGVEVRIVWDPPWSPAMMSVDAQEALGFRSR